MFSTHPSKLMDPSALFATAVNALVPSPTRESKKFSWIAVVVVNSWASLTIPSLVIVKVVDRVVFWLFNVIW